MIGACGRLGLAISIFVVAMTIHMPVRGETAVTIQQGWSTEQKKQWYTQSQGSRLIPLDWLLEIEQPEPSHDKFLATEHIEKFRYLPSPYSKLGLPVGFTIDEQANKRFGKTQLEWKDDPSPREKWVGMNCSACHTAEITYTGKRMRIEGAPTLADFRGFINALNKALHETQHGDKFKRFVENLRKRPGGQENKVDEDKLKEALKSLVKWQDDVDAANFTKDTLAYGFGRLDAFGHIFNKVTLALKRPNDPPPHHQSDAPVSYPYLWNVPRLNKLQWNGIANKKMFGNLDVGALGRNVGEVTGVFADVTWKYVEGQGDSKVLAIDSSADVKSLINLEKQLENLNPPLWPTGALGKIADRKVRDGKDIGGRDIGRELYISEDRKYADGTAIPSCTSCHKSLRRNRRSLFVNVNVEMVPLKKIGTDIWMACNAMTNEASAGYLTGVKVPGDSPLPEEAAVARLTAATVISTLVDVRNIATILASKPFSSPDKQMGESFSKPSKNGLEPHPEPYTGAVPLADEAPVRSVNKQKLHNRC